MQFYSPSWLGQEDSEKTCEFSSIQAIVQLRLLLKQQANKQWVKTLSTHLKLACWWVILYSEKKNMLV